jgi:hypothetical protein
VKREASYRLGRGAAVLLVLSLAVAAGYWGRIIQQRHAAAMTSPAEKPLDGLASLLAERRLHASTAAMGESFAMATGSIDSDVEGLFLLDFVTGELQCIVLNYRSGKFNAIFRANVQADLGVDPAKRPKYLMTTGTINFPRGASAARPGNSVVYVMDTASGNFCAYAIPWRRELAATARPQAGGLMLMDVGTVRTGALRE